MKIRISKMLVVLSMLVAANIAHAGLFGFTTTVQARDPSNNFHSHTITTGTAGDCEIQRELVISNWQSLDYSIESNPPCGPVSINPIPDPDKYQVLDWLEGIRWPWPGPVCLSCPLLRPEIIDRLYPKVVDKVNDLIQGYGIDQYNQEIQKLQESYDLQGFENEMHNLEQQLRVDSLNR